MRKTLFTTFFLILFSGSAFCATEAKPKVVVSIKPLHSIVAGVMKGVAEPTLLVKGGGSPHSYSLRPSEARSLAKADLIIWVGHSLESFLEKPLSTLGEGSHQLELAEELESSLLPMREGGNWEAHAHDHHGKEDEHHHDAEHHEHHGEKDQHHHDAEHHEHHGEKDEHHHEAEHHGHHGEKGEHHAEECGHHHGEHDPHLWLSPRQAKQIVQITADHLSEIDPAHSELYMQNASELKKRLANLDADLKERLSPVKEIPYIVFHDAYQYFEKAFGLNAIGSITIDPERRPGAKRISEIRKRIKELNAQCVFSEPQFEPRLVASIIEGTDAKTGVLDPLGAELPTGPESYFMLMNALADSLVKNLSR